MLKRMNLNIKKMFLLMLFSANIFAADESLELILKKSILESGYLEPKKLYINNFENLEVEGKIFLRAKKLSLNGNIACSTCHILEKGSSDGIPNAAGIYGTGEGEQRIMSGALIVPRNTLGLWGVGSKGFETFFWDGRVSLHGQKIISQFGSQQPSNDPLIVAVHLPAVEIRETLDEDDFVLQNKLESLGGAKNVFEAVTHKLKINEPETINNLALKLNKKVKDIEYLDIAKSIASFIRSEFRIKETKLDRFVKSEVKVFKKRIKWWYYILWERRLCSMSFWSAFHRF